MVSCWPPLAFAGAFLDGQAVSAALLATVLFCLASSATYVVNDLHDIERDRRHPSKSLSRPLACEQVSRGAALTLLAVLYALLLGSWWLVPA